MKKVGAWFDRSTGRRWLLLALAGLCLHLGAFPLVFHLAVLPATPAAGPAWWVETRQEGRRETFRAPGRGLALARPQSSLLALSVWHVPASGVRGLGVACDDRCRLWLDGRPVIRQTGISAANLSIQGVFVKKGPHLLALELINGPGRGRAALCARLAPTPLPFPEAELVGPSLGNLAQWWNAARAGGWAGLLFMALAGAGALARALRGQGGDGASHALALAAACGASLLLVAPLLPGEPAAWLGQALAAWLVLTYLALAFRACSSLGDRLTHIFLALFAAALWLARSQVVVGHEPIMEGAFWGYVRAPNRYRILLPWLGAWLCELLPALGWPQAASALNLSLALAAMSCGLAFFRLWMGRGLALTGVILMGLLSALSFWFDYPGDFGQLAFFAAGLYLIKARDWPRLLPLLALGALFRETTGALVAAFFFVNFSWRRPWPAIWKSAGLVVVWLIPVILVRWAQGPAPYQGEYWQWARNLFYLYAHPKARLLLFWTAPFLALAALGGWRKVDPFLKRNLLTCLLLFIAGMGAGCVEEIRIFLPLLVVLIPLGLSPFSGRKQARPKAG